MSDVINFRLIRILGAEIMIRFLFEAGLPYLSFRTAVRSNSAAVINDMYTYMIPIFHATHKYLYAKLCVLCLHTHFIMKPEIRDVWERMRTASLRGHIGRNVGWDFTLERMNLEVATMLGNDVSGDRIQEIIRQLNGIRYVRGPALNALGIGNDSEIHEYHGILDSDVQALVHHLKEALLFDGQNDSAKLFRARRNVFRSDGSVTPWNRIAQAEAKEPISDYVQRMLRLAPRNTMQ